MRKAFKVFVAILLSFSIIIFCFSFGGLIGDVFNSILYFWHDFRNVRVLTSVSRETDKMFDESPCQGWAGVGDRLGIKTGCYWSSFRNKNDGNYLYRFVNTGRTEVHIRADVIIRYLGRPRLDLGSGKRIYFEHSSSRPSVIKISKLWLCQGWARSPWGAGFVDLLVPQK